MKPQFLRHLTRWVGALAFLACMALPAAADHESVRIHMPSGPLTGDVQPFIQDGTAYVSLVDFARAMDKPSVTWDGTSAHVTSEQIGITATPGQLWVEANGRCLYVPDGVRLVSGRTILPVRTLAQIYGADVTWDAETKTVFVTGNVQPLENGEHYYDENTLYWLSRVISAESQGEELIGQIAVGNVVLNRLESETFPNDLYQVIFQPGQFEPVENGTIYNDPYHLSVIAAKLCLEGAQVVEDCLYFFAPALSPGTWIVNNRTYFTTIGCHRFYL